MVKKEEKKEKINTPAEEGAEMADTANNAQDPEGVGSETTKENEMVTIPLSEYAAQLEEIDHLTMKADEFSEGWQRERAEFANYRKRMGRDLDAQRDNFKVDIIKKYLAVKDDLDRALKNLPESLKGEAWINGIELIDQKLATLLEGEGIVPVPAEGLAFDPQVLEAITSEENDEVESGFIIEVVQQGYKLGERVIRPALVRVSK
mgnify:FL=1